LGGPTPLTRVNRYLRYAAIAAGALLVIGLVSVGDLFAPAGALRPGDAKATALGQQVYAAHCAACHGARLEGQPNWRQRGADGRFPAPPHDATGHTWHHPDRVLFRITKFGVGKATGMQSYVSAMPAYEGVLSDEEIVAVLSWIKAQWPAAVRAQQDEMNRSTTTRHNGATMGIVLVGILASALVTVGVWLYLRWRHRRTNLSGSRSGPAKTRGSMRKKRR
jgi:mono/diheme cytochrome c family protein